MRIEKTYKLHKVVATDKDLETHRYDPRFQTFRHIFLDDGTAFAGNPFLFVAVPCEMEDGETRGGITAQDYLELGKEKSQRGYSFVCFVANGVIQWGEFRAKRPDMKQFPLAEVVQKLANAANNKGQRVCLNVKNLKVIADAPGTENVTLTLAEKPSEQAVHITGDHGGEAVLMPIHLR